jgi:hypothetical protein
MTPERPRNPRIREIRASIRTAIKKVVGYLGYLGWKANTFLAYRSRLNGSSSQVVADQPPWTHTELLRSKNIRRDLCERGKRYRVEGAAFITKYGPNESTPKVRFHFEQFGCDLLRIVLRRGRDVTAYQSERCAFAPQTCHNRETSTDSTTPVDWSCVAACWVGGWRHWNWLVVSPGHSEHPVSARSGWAGG